MTTVRNRGRTGTSAVRLVLTERIHALTKAQRATIEESSAAGEYVALHGAARAGTLTYAEIKEGLAKSDSQLGRNLEVALAEIDSDASGVRAVAPVRRCSSVPGVF